MYKHLPIKINFIKMKSIIIKKCLYKYSYKSWLNQLNMLIILIKNSRDYTVKLLIS